MRKILIILMFCYNFSISQNSDYKQIEKNTLQGTKVGVSKENKVIIPTEYDVIGEYSEGKFVAVKNQKVGIIDTLNNVIVPFKYSFATNFVNGRTFLSIHEKLAMADDKGKILTPFEYDDILGFENGIARVLIGDKIAYINNKGKMIISPKFNEGYDCYGNFILVYSSAWKSLGYEYVQRDFYGNVIDKGDIGMSGKFPIIFDKEGKLIYKGQFGEKIEFTPDFNLAVSNRYINSGEYEYNIIDNQGKILKNYLGPYSVKIEDYWISYAIKSNYNYKYGIINFKGEEVLQPNFKSISAYEFDNKNLAKVEFFNGEYFYINKEVVCVEFNEKKCPEE